MDTRLPDCRGAIDFFLRNLYNIDPEGHSADF